MNYWQGEKIRLRASEPTDWEIFYKWDTHSERSAISKSDSERL